ncbi:hypothetical protein [Bradyrhizobium sp. SEMIA]|uniref:hypothetical protein n=1 Tax=Bradyrhizobium sp. SEMIA TaxID=2597515 RepID=UPI00223FA679|nr:hypothetical protein [Bradyrhizobium sp. SEMIA]
MTLHRRRVKQTRSLEERMAEQTARLKERASQLPAGPEREALLKSEPALRKPARTLAIG